MDSTDEFFHEPTDERFWSESHYIDAIAEGGETAVHARIGFYPNRDVATVFAYLLTGEYVHWIRDESVPLRDVHGLVVERDAWSLRFVPEHLDERWRVELEGVLSKSPIGEPATLLEDGGATSDVALSLTSTNRHPRFHYTDGAVFPSSDGADRYEVATSVAGSATVDGTTIALDGCGERDHSWGERRWAGPAEWLWISGAFDDGTAYNHLSFWLADHPDTRWINGFWFDGEERVPLTDATVTATPSFGADSARAWRDGSSRPSIEVALEWAGGQRTVTAEPWATTPLEWTGDEGHGLLNRSPARQRTEDGSDGRGFLEHMCQLE